MNALKADIMAHAQKMIGVDFSEMEQGSADWQYCKLGVMTASEAEFILAGKKTDKRMNYIYKKVGQIITGVPEEKFTAKATNWGKDHEAAARAAYCFEKRVEVLNVPIIYKDLSLRTACSPDGLTPNGGIEIKCPIASREFVKAAHRKELKPDQEQQVQFTLWNCEIDYWEGVVFDPRAMKKKLLILPREPDLEVFKKLDDCVAECIEQMDAVLKELGYTFGDQWRDRITVASEVSKNVG